VSLQPLKALVRRHSLLVRGRDVARACNVSAHLAGEGLLVEPERPRLAAVERVARRGQVLIDVAV
jgi:hypothetical protein